MTAETKHPIGAADVNPTGALRAAVTSLVLGLMGLLLWGVYYAAAPIPAGPAVERVLAFSSVATLLGVAALFLGITAWNRIRQSVGRLAGRDTAVAAVYVAGILLLMTVVFTWRNLGQELQRARPQANSVRSRSNLTMIAKSAHTWLSRKGHGQFYPPSLKSLFNDGVITERRTFVCPADSEPRHEQGSFACDYDSLFDRAGSRISRQAIQPELPLAWENRDFYPLLGDRRSVVFFDGHTEFVTADRFRELMKTADKWVEQHRPKDGR